MVESIEYNHSIVVLKTGPAAAPLIARVLDSLGEAIGIMGVVAGDDTLFIAPTLPTEVAKLADTLRELLDCNDTSN